MFGLSAFDWIFLILGLYLILFSLAFFSFGISVQVKVVDQKMSDTSYKLIFSPEYEITSGEFSGVRKKSTIGTGWGTHRTGTERAGLYLKRFEMVESKVSLMVVAAIGVLIVAAVLDFWP